jgi:hypothetical protein
MKPLPTAHNPPPTDMPIFQDPARVLHLVEKGHGGPHPAAAVSFMRRAMSEELVDRALIHSLPLDLKDNVDGLLARGVDKAVLLECVREAAGGRWPMTVLMVEAYLHTVGIEQGAVSSKGKPAS